MNYLSPLKYIFHGFVLFFLLQACSSESTGTEEPPNTDDELLSLNFQSTSAAPFETVSFTGIPDNKNESDLWAEIIPGDGSEQYQTMIYKDGSEWVMRVPIYFPAPMEGGEVQIYIIGKNGTETERSSFTIKPLPQADGEFQNVATSLSNLLTKYLETAGTSRDELDSADLGQLDDVQIPLYLSYWVIDNPANENNLVNLSAGSALQNFENVDLEFVNALSSSMEFTSLLEMAHQNIDSLDVRLQSSELSSYKGPSAFNRSNFVDIEDQEGCENELNSLMWAAEYADSFNSEAGQQILNRTGQALAVLTVLSPVPFTKGVSGTVGAAVFGLGNILSAIENLYPSRFVESDLVLSPTDFPEDSEGGTWKLEVVAASNGWSVDKAILEAMLQYVGLKGVKNLDSVINTEGLSEAGEAFYDAVLGETLNQFISGAAGDPSSGIVRIPEQRWPCDLKKLAKINIPLDEALVEDPGGENRVKTNKVGTARVRGDKKKGTFGFQSPLSIKFAEVHAIEITASPNKINVEPGDPVFLDSQIRWANDKKRDWKTTEGEVFGGSNNQKTAVLRTPDKRWDDPIEVTVTSLAKGGLRGKDGAPPRTAVVLVTADEVTIKISPRWACIEEGESLSFQAEVTGVDGDPEIEWEATAGFFNGSTYSAPGSNVGNVTVTATLVGEDVSDSVIIRVDDCLCYWNADFSGSLSGGSEGDYAVYEDIFVEGESGTQFTFWPSVTNNRPAIFATSIPRIGNTFTGSIKSLVTLIVNNSANSDWVSLEDPFYGIVLPTNSITFNGGDVREGIISGQLVQFDLDVQPPTIDFAGITVRYVARRKTSGNLNPCE